MYKIDNVDTEILHLLKEDGRVPYAAIAKKVGLTSTAVSQRIQKMVDEGMIEGFGVKLKLEK
ncbi:MAG: AsnC family transcriptional regulator, partial [Bacteroidota bacterium]